MEKFSRQGQKKEKTPTLDKASEVLGLPDRVETLEVAMEEQYKEICDKISILEKALLDAGIKVPTAEKIYPDKESK